MSKFLEDRGVRLAGGIQGLHAAWQRVARCGHRAVDGTGGAMLGATVAHNATTYNFLGHADKAERDRLKAKSQSGQKLSPEESARLVYLEAADRASDGLLEKHRAGGRGAFRLNSKICRSTSDSTNCRMARQPRTPDLKNGPKPPIAIRLLVRRKCSWRTWISHGPTRAAGTDS